MSRRRTRATPQRATAPAARGIAVPGGRHVRHLMALLVAATVVTYANSLSNPLIMDDRIAITENPQIKTLWLPIALSPPDESPMARRPLVNLSLAVNYALGGLDVRGYHLANLAIHVLAGLVLFGLVRRTLADERFGTALGPHATALAAISALIWLLHPLQTEIVNYVTQRTTAMMGLAYLLTLYSSARALQDSPQRWTAAAILACAAGMASKETMVTAPILVVLFDRVFVFARMRDALIARRTLYVGLASTWLLLAALMLSGERSTVGFGTGVSPATYLLNQCAIVVQYLRLTFWPHALVVDYGMPQPLGLGDVGVEAALLTALALAAVVALRFAPRAGFLGAAFFILLAPTSSVVPIATEVGAERRMYLPLAALVVLLVWAGHRTAAAALDWARQRWSRRGSLDGRVWRLAAMTAVAVLCAVLGVQAALRNHEYRTRVDLWSVTVERRPHGRAYMSLGKALSDAGRTQEAMHSFRRASADFPPGHLALGTELLIAGQVDAGVEQIRRFMHLAPDSPAVAGAHLMIGTAFLDLKRYADAADELRPAVNMLPGNAWARLNLGEALVHSGGSREALGHLRAAAQAMPRDARAHNVLGAALAEAGRLDDAIQEFETALALDPQHGGARANLAQARQLRNAIAAGDTPSLRSRGERE